jgi:hypothetical protein
LTVERDRATRWLQPLKSALDEADRPLDFFFRDDDVGWDDSRLFELLDVFAARSLPLDLAVIPLELTGRLADALSERVSSGSGSIDFHQHGFSHSNHESTGRKYEFGPSRPRWLQERDILEGRKLLEGLLGPSVAPIFTPPWNRCTPTTAQCLAELGFKVLSREWRAVPFGQEGLAELPIRVDWFAHLKHVRLDRNELGALIGEAARSGGPVGLMFHHAAMNRDDLAAMGDLLDVLAQHCNSSAWPMRMLARAPAQK